MNRAHLVNLKLLAVLFLFPFISSCKKNPIDRLTNPLPDGDVPQSSGIFIIYDGELKTGGGLSFIPGGENQSIDLLDTNEPRFSNRQIRYTWNGSNVASQHLFAGFNLLVTPDGSTLAAATGKNLSTPAYTKLTLRIRGNLSSGNTLRIEGPSDNGVATVPSRTEITAANLSNSTWQSVTLNVPGSFFSNVKIFVTFSIQYTQPPRTTNPGEGGTIYLDAIQYER